MAGWVDKSASGEAAAETPIVMQEESAVQDKLVTGPQKETVAPSADGYKDGSASSLEKDLKTKSADEYNVLRGIFKTGASLSTKFYKIMDVDTEFFGVPVKRLRHIITPSIDYVYMHDPTVAKRMADGGVNIVLSKSPADFAAFHKKENDRFAKVIKDANIETE